jgi:hypothetical protein
MPPASLLEEDTTIMVNLSGPDMTSPQHPVERSEAANEKTSELASEAAELGAYERFQQLKKDMEELRHSLDQVSRLKTLSAGQVALEYRLRKDIDVQAKTMYDLQFQMAPEDIDRMDYEDVIECFSDNHTAQDEEAGGVM